ncbi:hypothetical protein L1049_009865 [Liquidambar formosana]|uniref:Coatomer subunit zeta n=1 Tax=Liquidambar formosana TaxID=63359 RepID=A0AAP0NAD3_LIQFO
MNARFIYGRGVGDNSHILSITLRTSTDPRRVFEHINMESCPSIRNILLLDSEGKRVAVKYYSDDWPTHNAKEAFEKAVFTKTQKTNARTEEDNEERKTGEARHEHTQFAEVKRSG